MKKSSKQSTRDILKKLLSINTGFYQAYCVTEGRILSDWLAVESASEVAKEHKARHSHLTKLVAKSV